MKDANVYLVSNATVTASYNGSAYDFDTTPGSPMRGFEFTAYLGTSGSIVNTTTAGTITYQYMDSPDTSFTAGPTYTEYQAISASVTATPGPISIPVKLQNPYGRLTIIPGTGITLNGINVQLDCARTG